MSNKDEKINIIMFTDGSCIKKKNTEAKCGYGVYFPNKELKNISKSFDIGELTNQRAELYAIYKGIKKVCHNVDFDFLNIYTDSEYSIKSLTIWIENWKKNKWKTANNKEVANQDIIKKIDKYLQKYKTKIYFHHIRSHTGKQDFYSLCNEKADNLATSGALL
jgi:ribonuclease HI